MELLINSDTIFEKSLKLAIWGSLESSSLDSPQLWRIIVDFLKWITELLISVINTAHEWSPKSDLEKTHIYIYEQNLFIEKSKNEVWFIQYGNLFSDLRIWAQVETLYISGGTYLVLFRSKNQWDSSYREQRNRPNSVQRMRMSLIRT